MVYTYYVTRFYVGKPTRPKDLIDRKNECSYVLERLKSKKISYNVALLGYRRIGKTSIIIKIQNQLDKDPNFVTVYFDVKHNMAEPKTFLNRLEKAIFDAYITKLGLSAKIGTKTSKASIEIFSRIKDALTSKKIKSVGASLSTDGIITPTIEFGEKQVSDYSSLFLSVLHTPTAFADKSGLKFVIVLDEFQDLSKLDRYPGLKDIFGLFRGIIQQRGDNVSFVISGSRVHMLKNILGSGESSLFVHFQILNVGEMDEENSVTLFNAYLTARKIKPNNALAKQAFQLVGGQPFYLMALADWWSPKNKIEDVYKHSLTDSLGSLKLYTDYLLSEDLGEVQSGPISITILQVLASHGSCSISEIAKLINTSITKLPRYLTPLLNADLILKKDGKYSIRDKILRDYLKFQLESLM